MLLATLVRFKEGALNKVWAGHGCSVVGNLVFLAEQLNAGLIAITSQLEIEKVAQLCDGLLLPGNSNNIDPKHFGGDPFDPPDYWDEYESLDSKAIEAFHRAGKPIFGICGGMQSINVYFGGTLKLVPNKENHWAYRDPDPVDRYGNAIKYREHPVTVEADSFVADVHGPGRAIVNTYHSWAVDKVAPGFRVVATSDDGTIEAIECREKNIFAVQWHPELAYRMADPVEQKFFENFLAVCAKEKK